MNIRNTQFVFALLSAANSIESRLNRALSNVKGISFTEYFILEQLNDFHNAAATRVDLARTVNLSPSAVTRALKPLEKVGYVSTKKGERDARQSIASLTPAGKKLLKDANSIVRDEIALLPIPRSVRSELIGVMNSLTPK